MHMSGENKHKNKNKKSNGAVICRRKGCNKSCGRIHEDASELLCNKRNCSGENCQFKHEKRSVKNARQVRSEYLKRIGVGIDPFHLTTFQGNRGLETLEKLKEDDLSSFVSAMVFYNEHHNDVLVSHFDSYLKNFKTVLERPEIQCYEKGARNRNCFEVTVMPLLIFLSDNKFESSVLETFKNRTFEIFLDLKQNFELVYYQCLEDLVKRGLSNYWEDSYISRCYKPIFFTEMFYPLLKVLLDVPRYTIKGRLEKTEWERIFLLFAGLYQQANQLGCFRDDDPKMVERIELLIMKVEQPKPKLNKTNKIAVEASVKFFKGPGSRHDNDFEIFSEINIIPTRAELQSRDKPFLPLNQKNGNVEGLNPLNCLLDTHFRLMREDVVYFLREAFQVVESKAKVIQALNKTEYKRFGKVALQIYNSVKILRPTTTEKGASFVLEFEQISLKSGKKKNLKEIYERKGSFGMDQCYFLLENDRIMICVISESDIKEYASKSPKVTIFPIEKADVDYLTERWAKMDQKTLKLIELPKVSLIGFKSVLEALKELAYSENEILNHITYEGNIEVLKSPPKYLQVPDPSWNLRHLLNKESQDLFLETNELLIEDSIEIVKSALSDWSTMDETQSQALCAALTQKVTLIKGPPGTGKSYTEAE
eukprot:NODE_256_length_11672_cov_0.220168.p2 type:complete len:651 gc:universal NODE_256_length_11672_cov_0.220168:6764-4812(-)